MASVPSPIIGLVVLVFAGYVGRDVWTYIDQYRTIADIDPSNEPVMESGETVTVQGATRVTDPVPPEDLPDEGGNDEHDVGLYVWRIRRKRRRTGSDGVRTSWTTEDAGLQAGRFTVETEADEIHVDRDAVSDIVPSGLGTNDPWESTELHLGDPNTDISISDTENLVHGPDTDLGSSSTSDPGRFQANQIADGEEAIIHGELEETANGLAITSGKTSPLVVATGSMADLAGELRKKIAYNVLITGILLVVAGAAFGGLLDIGNIGL